MEGWQADPTGRHQERYHDGAGWTDRVRDRGIENRDPVGGGAPARSGPPRPVPAPVVGLPGPGGPARGGGDKAVFGKIGGGGASPRPPAGPPAAPGAGSPAGPPSPRWAPAPSGPYAPVSPAGPAGPPAFDAGVPLGGWSATEPPAAAAAPAPAVAVGPGGGSVPRPRLPGRFGAPWTVLAIVVAVAVVAGAVTAVVVWRGKGDNGSAQADAQPTGQRTGPTGTGGEGPGSGSGSGTSSDEGGDPAPTRSAEAFCATMTSEQERILAQFQQNAGPGPTESDDFAEAFMTVFASVQALGELRTYFDKLAKVAPDEIQTEAEIIAEKMDTILEGPDVSVEGVVKSMMLAIELSGPLDTLNAYALEHCGKGI